MASLLIQPTPEQLLAGLEAWHWVGLDGKTPFAVTAFGDVFLESRDGIWFLDTIEGTLALVAHSRDELQAILNSEEGQDRYLLAGFVIRAENEGRTLAEGQCYDFKVNPVLGGSIEYENIQIQDFVVALNVAGQIHEQAKNMPPGAKISEFKIS